MLSPEQEAWINTLPDITISIIPYDPRAGEFFNIIKKKIHNLLGEDVLVEHGGSTIFGIVGQDEVDISIVAPKEKFAEYIPKLETLFGPVCSFHPGRAKFEVKENDKKIDLKITDENHPLYIEGKIFTEYLSTHPGDLEHYKILKEKCNGLLIKEYQRRKIEFTNYILEKAKVKLIT